jgi:hypothetical protein
VKWTTGSLEVTDVWERLAGDVTHYDGKKYLTLIDCGPVRFTIWKLLGDEGAEEITANVETVFREHGAPRELLLDNATSFRSRTFKAMCAKWNVALRYRCAHRPSGNGIVERVHRTIKRMAARTRANVFDMAYFYNVSPRDGTKADSVPANKMCRYDWRVPGCADRGERDVRKNRDFVIGQRVYVKPGYNRCTTEWPIGVVTQVTSDTQVEVNGMPRHVADLRLVPHVVVQVPTNQADQDLAGVGIELISGGESEDSDSDDSEDGDDTLPAAEDVGRRYPRRDSRAPVRFDEFVLD